MLRDLRGTVHEALAMLWDIFEMTQDPSFRRVMCVLDVLDEYKAE